MFTIFQFELVFLFVLSNVVKISTRTTKNIGVQLHTSENEDCDGIKIDEEDEGINGHIKCFQPLAALFWDETNTPPQKSGKCFVLGFYAFHRHFKLILKTKSAPANDTLRVNIFDQDGNNEFNLTRERLVTGHVQGENESIVQGWYNFKKHEFEGTIITETIYFVERVHRKSKYVNLPWNIIIYKSTDKSLTNLFQKDVVNERKTSTKRLHRRKRFLIINDIHENYAHGRNNKVCTIHVLADHLFFEYIGYSSVTMAIREIEYQLNSADAIFRASDFDEDGDSDNIGLRIAKITIYKNPRPDLNKHYANPYKFLNAAYSRHDMSDYCLASFLTYRDFKSGVIGMAWRPDPGEIFYGICQKPIIQGLTSKNGNFVTYLNFNKRIPRHQIAVALAHEIGHNFGAYHDTKNSPPDCVPSGDNGNYIMYEMASSGLQRNNRLFSICSKRDIMRVLKFNAICFLDDFTLCGNGVREANEECDCGDTEQCNSIDHCCTPSDSRTGQPCTIRRDKGYTCTGSALCCDSETCHIITAEMKFVCNYALECTQHSTCDGIHVHCPLPSQQPDGFPCGHGAHICSNGQCNQTRCHEQSKVDCQCSEKENLCVLCCKEPNRQETCSPYISPATGKVLQLKHGELCKDYRGFCDANSQCVIQNLEVIDRFLTITTDEGWTQVALWLKASWMVWVFFALSIVVVPVVLFKTKLMRRQLQIHHIAYKTGTLANVWFDARIHQARIAKKINFLDRMRYTAEFRMNLLTAIVRIKTFFPTLSNKAACRVVNKCSNEEAAVTRLLLEGYPARKIGNVVGRNEKSEMHVGR